MIDKCVFNLSFFNLWSIGLFIFQTWDNSAIIFLAMKIATEAGMTLNTNKQTNKQTNKLIDLPTEPEGGTQSVVNHCSNVTAAVIGISKVQATDVDITPKYKTTQSEQLYLIDQSTVDRCSSSSPRNLWPTN